MSVATIRQMADRVSDLMRQRLGIKGASLSEQLRRGGRKLPRRVRQSAELLAAASEMVMTPKLQARLDEAKVAEAYDICLRYLGPLGRADRRNAYFGGVGASLGLGLLVIGAGLIGWLYWKGLI